MLQVTFCVIQADVLCVMDIKGAVPANVPCFGNLTQDDPVRVITGPRHLSAAFGERIIAPRLLDKPSSYDSSCPSVARATTMASGISWVSAR